MNDETPQPDSREYVPELDGLRGLAILSVLFHHLLPSGAPHVVESIASRGWLGVDLFFVISGFLIAGILADTKGRKQWLRVFLFRRSLRIFPLYYAYLGFVFLVAFVLSRNGGNPEAVVPNVSPLWLLLYGGNLLESALGVEVPVLVRHLWSLSIEEHFYLVFPLIVAVCSPRQLWAVLVVIFALALGTRLACAWYFPLNHHLQYQLTPCRMDSIATGCLLALLFRVPHSSELRKKAAVGTLATCIVLAVVIAWVDGWDRKGFATKTFGYTVLSLLMAAVVALTIHYRRTAATGWLRWSWLTYVGRISYGAYVTHRASQVVVNKCAAYAGLSDWYWLLIASFAVSLLVAALSWNCFEKPFLNLKKLFVVDAAK